MKDVHRTMIASTPATISTTQRAVDTAFLRRRADQSRRDYGILNTATTVLGEHRAPTRAFALGLARVVDGDDVARPSAYSHTAMVDPRNTEKAVAMLWRQFAYVVAAQASFASAVSSVPAAGTGVGSPDAGHRLSALRVSVAGCGRAGRYGAGRCDRRDSR